MFRHAARLIGRRSTNLLTTSRPLTAFATISQTLSLSPSSPQTLQLQTRSFRTAPRRQADSDARGQQSSALESEVESPKFETKVGNPHRNPPKLYDQAFYSTPHLWDMPEDPRIAHLKSPWRPRDLGSWERHYYESHGPNYLEHVGETRRKHAEGQLSARATYAAKLERKLGPDWYEIHSEAKKLEAERTAPVKATEEYAQLQRRLQALRLRLKELQAQGAAQAESPQYAESEAVFLERKQLRKDLQRLVSLGSAGTVNALIQEVVERRAKTSE